MHKPVRLLSSHRSARLIAWALAMLAWIVGVLAGARALAPRHLLQRQRFLSLHRLRLLTCRLAIIRAAELTGLRPRRSVSRNFAPSGFRRRTTPRAMMRACLGARLRKALKRGDHAERLRFLTVALSDIDAFTRRYLTPRALRGLTKLCAIVLATPAAAVILGPPASPPARADSS